MTVKRVSDGQVGQNVNYERICSAGRLRVGRQGYRTVI